MTFTVRLRVRWMGQCIGPWSEEGVRLALRRGFGGILLPQQRFLIGRIKRMDEGYYR